MVLEGELKRHLDEIDRHLAAVRELIRGTDKSQESQRRKNVGPYDHLDRSRRRRPEWLRRGIVFELVERREPVDADDFEIIMLAAGYKDPRAGNRFFAGDPEPVLERNGDEVGLTERGRSAAAFFRSWWLPQLETGTEKWPTAEAKRLLGGGAV